MIKVQIKYKRGMFLFGPHDQSTNKVQKIMEYGEVTFLKHKVHLCTLCFRKVTFHTTIITLSTTPTPTPNPHPTTLHPTRLQDS